MKLLALVLVAVGIVSATATPEVPSANRTLVEQVEEASALKSLFNQKKFKQLFPQAKSLYSYDGLVEAAKKFPKFLNNGDVKKNKRELAAFLAQTAHESDNFKAAEEYGASKYPVSQYCDTGSGVKCVKGKRYHGRGAIQLSWNYNYNAAGKALGANLLGYPEQAGKQKRLAWGTAVWYWMTPQKGGRIIHNVVNKSNGFAQSTDIINGALECGGPAKHKEKQRIQLYKKMCKALGVSPVSKVSCN